MRDLRDELVERRAVVDGYDVEAWTCVIGDKDMVFFRLDNERVEWMDSVRGSIAAAAAAVLVVLADWASAASNVST